MLVPKATFHHCMIFGTRWSPGPTRLSDSKQASKVPQPKVPGLRPHHFGAKGHVSPLHDFWDALVPWADSTVRQQASKQASKQGADASGRGRLALLSLSPGERKERHSILPAVVPSNLFYMVVFSHLPQSPGTGVSQSARRTCPPLPEVK